eukprot:1780111-Prymnesium_polylepis.1
MCVLSACTRSAGWLLQRYRMGVDRGCAPVQQYDHVGVYAWQVRACCARLVNRPVLVQSLQCQILDIAAHTYRPVRGGMCQNRMGKREVRAGALRLYSRYASLLSLANGNRR